MLKKYVGQGSEEVASVPSKQVTQTVSRQFAATIQPCQVILENLWRSGFNASTCFAAWFLGVCGTLLLPSPIDDQRAWLVALTSLLLWRARWRQQWGWLPFLIVGFLFANLQFLSHASAILPSQLEGHSVKLVGTVASLPMEDSARSRFDFQIEALAPLASMQDVTGDAPEVGRVLGKKIRLSCYRCKQRFTPGERWALTVRLKRPRGFASWAAFDYEKYLFRHQIVATGYVRGKEVNTFLGNTSSSSARVRAKLRDAFRAFKESDAGLGIFTALALGDKSLLSADQKQVFQVTGVSHLMAISGLHIGLVFALTSVLLNVLTRPVAMLYNHVPRQQLVLWPALAAAGGYAALAGFAVSTQRAMVMLCVFVICRCFARELSLLHVLIYAIGILLLLDPFSILDVGFWLSCLAVAMIALAQQRFSSLSLWRLQPWLWLAMMPVTAFFFGQVSFISPVVNLVAVPLFCLILIPVVLLSLVLLLLGIANLALPLIALLQAIFNWVFRSLDWLSNQDFAYAYPQQVSVWQVVLLSALLVLTLRYWRCLPVLLLSFMVCFWPTPSSFEPREYWVTLLDVGQGLAMVVESDDYVLVYDTGPTFSTGFSTAEAVVLPYLRSRGIRQIDHLVISHADSDHIGGLDQVLRGMPVAKISTSRVDKIPESMQARTDRCESGQQWSKGGINFRFISPDADTPRGSNNHSCVLLIDNHEIKTLITGDIERQVERYLVQHTPELLRARLLLVPHQGSKTSSTPAFIDAVNPEVALLAAGYRNHYGHPHADVVARYQTRGIELFSTIDVGSIRFVIKNGGWHSTAYRPSNKKFWRS